MANFAETLVEERLNRKGYFTVRGAKAGLPEIDLPAVRPVWQGTRDAMVATSTTACSGTLRYPH